MPESPGTRHRFGRSRATSSSVASRASSGPTKYAVIANYADQAAGEAHVASEHAQWFFGWLPSVVASVPKIVYQELPDAGWSEMGEVVME